LFGFLPSPTILVANSAGDNISFFIVASLEFKK
jgi:hypothetical protein